MSADVDQLPFADPAMTWTDPDLPIHIPGTPDPHRVAHLHRTRRREHRRLARMRLYSYLLTLTACVFALMTFMYVVQGQADHDTTFLSLGAMFAAFTGFLLWAAIRVTQAGEEPLRG